MRERRGPRFLSVCLRSSSTERQRADGARELADIFLASKIARQADCRGRAAFRGPCAEGEVNQVDQQPIRASLPFLSTVAGALVLAELMKLQSPHASIGAAETKIRAALVNSPSFLVQVTLPACNSVQWSTARMAILAMLAI